MHNTSHQIKIQARHQSSSANRADSMLGQAVVNLVTAFDKQSRSMPKPTAMMQEKPPFGYRRLYDPAQMSERKKWAESLAGDTKKTIKASLSLAEKLGVNRRIATAPDPAVLNALGKDFPNFSEVTRIIRLRLQLSRCSAEKVCRLPPMLLVGPPGVGKTAYSKRLAGLLGVTYTENDVSTMTAAFALSGLDSGYSTGGPGRVWQALHSGQGCMSTMFLLDEIDKAGADTKDSHLGFLYGLLERESAKTFQDAALMLPIDASHLIWLAACNSTENLDSALLSRFEILQITQPTVVQMRAVVASVHRELVRDADWSDAFDTTLDDNVVTALSGRSPRLVRRALEQAFANAAFAGRRRIDANDIEDPGVTQINDAQRIPVGFIDTRSAGKPVGNAAVRETEHD